LLLVAVALALVGIALFASNVRATIDVKLLSYPNMKAIFYGFSAFIF